MLAMKSNQQTETDFSLEKWLSLGSKVSFGRSRDINYLAYDERSAEHDLITMAQVLVSGFKPTGWFGIRIPLATQLRFKLLFVFDELDKIDEGKGKTSSLVDILQALKSLFTTSGITFIFVAGRSLHEHWIEDVQRGDSIFESVFSELHYLPAVWEQVDEICDPLLSAATKLSDYERQLYTDFKKYLAFSGRGIPRRILREFYERVHWDGQRASLTLSERDRRQMRFHADLYGLLTASENRILGPYAGDLRPDWCDKQRLGLYYLVDWILDRGTAAFGLQDLIDAASTQLRGGIAPAPEIAPSVAEALLEVMCEHEYLERFTAPSTDAGEQAVMYRVWSRRLIEMGRYRELTSSIPHHNEGVILSDRYQLLEQVGQGGSAQVFRALDRHNGTIVAIKRFFKEYFSDDSSLQDRLHAEAKVHRGLHHEGIAQLLDVYFNEDRPFMVLEYLDGITLRRLLQATGPMPSEAVITVIRSLLATLTYLHSKGVLWRDVKPSNVFLTKKGRVAILDFGIAQTVGDANVGPDSTRIGFRVGTPKYESPEQISGKALTPASDLFALGIIFYEMLVGRTPGNSTVDFLMNERLHIEIESDLQQIPAELRKVVQKALSVPVEARYQTAEDMLGALPEVDGHESITQLVIQAQQSPVEESVPLHDATLIRSIGKGDQHEVQVSRISELGSIISTSTPSTATASAASSRPGGWAESDSGRTSDEVEGTRNAALVEPHAITVPRGYSVVKVSDSEGTRYLGLFGSEVSIGRAPECDIKINDFVASRFHARLVRENSHYNVEDLNSTNGVYVEGKRIYRTRRLEDADEIQIGQAVLVFEPAELAFSRRITTGP
ncbi:MAG: protein kinase domain-containing protein [Caldilineaceae bacterium]